MSNQEAMLISGKLVTPKYKTSDKVYFIYKHGIVKSTVLNIQVIITRFDEIAIAYCVGNPKKFSAQGDLECGYVFDPRILESELFPTKQALINHLTELKI